MGQVKLITRCLPLRQQPASWAPRLLVEGTEVPEHRHNHVGPRTKREATVGICRCSGVPVKISRFSGRCLFVSCDVGCTNPLQTSQRNTQGTRPRNKDTQRSQDCQAPPESNRDQRGPKRKILAFSVHPRLGSHALCPADDAIAVLSSTQAVSTNTCSRT